MPPVQSSADFGPSTQQFDTASTRDALPSGTRLGGYQIIDMLGRGRFGIVYLALDSSLQRQVAIKEYLPPALATRREGPLVALKPGADGAVFASGLADFLSEAKLLTRLDHPALARVHSFWEENRTAYMAMPYYHGQTLAATLKTLPHPPDETWLRSLLAPLLSGLNVLHTAQCHHRNISPDNIFILADGRPVLLDFGLSNRVIGDRVTARLNPAYAAIEQYPESATLPQGPWTDLYALAGVLHYAITRQVPVLATMRTIDDPQRPLADTVRTLQKLFPDLHYSEAFLAGIDKALSVKPRDRPHNAADFLLSLDRAMPAATPPPPTPTPVEPPAAFVAHREPVFEARPVREEWFTADSSGHAPAPRRRGPLWVAALCTLALVAIGGWWWTQMRTAAPSVAVAAAPPPSAVVIAPVVEPTPVDVPASAVAAGPAASLAMPASSAVAPEPEPVAAAASAAPVAPTAAAPVATAAPVPEAASEPSPEPAASRKVAQVAAAVEPDNPRAVCGPRTNFSLVYCMQTQCKKPKFAQHAQCLVMKQRGEIN